jgi:hypothetical protein
MTIKRLILSVLTVVVILFAGDSLLKSWQQPQIQSRLELYQTNLLLHSAEWQPKASDDANLTSARNTLVGEKPFAAATEQYQEARKLAQINLEKAKAKLEELRSQPVTLPTTPTQPEIAPVTNNSRQLEQELLQKSLNQLKQLSAELDLRLGLLQVQQGQIDAAIKTWTDLKERSPKESSLFETTTVLTGLWSNPPRLLPNAQQLIQDNLDGWFRYRALSQLYQLQQRQEALATLQAAEQEAAEQAFVKLALIGTIPGLAGLLGLGLLIFSVIQRLRKGKESLLAQNGDVAWSTPWSGEIVWQVFIVGFFLMGQLLIPLGFQLLNLKPAGANIRIQAFYVLASYLLVAFGGLAVLYLSIKRFLPLPEGWFRFNLRGNWFLWGLGGYCVALPLVVVVSLINQKLWQGQGGSNPLLSLVLSGHDKVALGIFFFTAAIAAPLFEEFLFRGFLLPSLTRYLPVSGAIITSSLLFAVAHLSLSEILPLTTLGIVLGVVYTRSRNLLAPMLVHSLWNSGTLLSLYILGSGSM